MALVVAAADTRLHRDFISQTWDIVIFFATTNDGDETYNSGININIYI